MEILTLLPVPIVIGAIAFLGVVYATLVFSGDRHQQLRAIVQTYTERADEPLPNSAVPTGSFWDRVIAPMGESLVGLLSSTAPTEMRTQSAEKLTQAGNPIGVSTFLALRAVAFFGLPLALLAYFKASGQPWGMSLLVLLGIGVLLGRMLPNMALNIAISSRQKVIEKSIPDALDLIVACVEGGLSLDGALTKVTERMPGPLADEIARALHEMRLGRPRREALEGLATRTGTQSVRSFSQAVSHAERMGVSIADILRTLGEQIRAKRKLRAQEMAQKAPIKMIPVIIVCILPSLFVVILGPAMIGILAGWPQ